MVTWRKYLLQVLSLIGVFLFCWLPYAALSLVGIFGLAEVNTDHI